MREIRRSGSKSGVRKRSYGCPFPFLLFARQKRLFVIHQHHPLHRKPARATDRFQQLRAVLREKNHGTSSDRRRRRVVARCSGAGMLKHHQADGPNRPILLKNPGSGAATIAVRVVVGEANLGRSPYVAKIGAGSGKSFASFRRFWAAAANRNSSLAPLGPRRRKRPSLRVGFR
jgi:hypothetical protein